MAKIKVELEIETDRPIEGEERQRYLCASLEEGIAYGWHDFLMNKDTMPGVVKSVTARVKA